MGVDTIDQSSTAAGAMQPNSMATAGLVCGIIGFVLSWIPLAGIWFGWILGVLAIIFGGIGISKAGHGRLGMGAAVAGLILGILCVVFKSIPVLNLL